MKKVLIALVVIFCLIGGYFYFSLYPKLFIVSGYASKNMASHHYISKRSVSDIQETDNNIKTINLSDVQLNDETQTASAAVFGLQKRKAVFRKGLGAAVMDPSKIDLSNLKQPNRNQPFIEKPYPFGHKKAKDTLFPEIDYTLIKKAIENAFTDRPDEQTLKNTRSVLVLYKNHIIAEKYAPGFDKNTPMIGWSMTKSLMATLFGVLEKQKGFDIYKPVTIFPEWLNDDRKNITTHHLIQMTSGLEWEEDYAVVGDVTKMLFEDLDMSKRAIQKPLEHQPNSFFYYSSGTSNILSAIIRNQFKDQQSYLDFPYQSLIDKIGMYSAIVETDPNGLYVASSYAWASTRDWAKFGLLYLNDGLWNGEQILPKAWVNYVQQPSEASKGEYGGHFWLNHGEYLLDAPKDVYYADGYQGQRVFIIPSKDMVIVRTGLTETIRTDAYDIMNDLIKDILKAVK